MLLRRVPGAAGQWIRLKVEAVGGHQRQQQGDQASVDSWVFRASDMAPNHTRHVMDRPRLGASPIRSL